MRNKPLHNVNEIQQIFEKTDLDAVVVLSPRSLWGLTGAARAFARRPGYRRNSCAIAFRNADPLLISGRFQEEPSLIFSWVKDITTYSDYLESPLARVAEVLRNRGLSSGKIGIEARSHTTEFYEDLVNDLGGAEFVPCDDLLDAIWTVKQPEEIEVLNENLQRMSEAIAIALNESKAGETEEAVHKRILAKMRRTGTAAVWGSLVSGDRLPQLTALPSKQTFATGDIFRIDYSYDRRNYPARVTRMGVVGRPSKEQESSHDRFHKAVENAISQIGPGQQGQAIYGTVVNALKERGFESNSPSFGNALGLGINLERPIIHPLEMYATEVGMVLSIEPVTVEGYKTSRQIVITVDGCEQVQGHYLPTADQLLVIGN